MYRLTSAVVVGTYIIDVFARAHILIGISGLCGCADLHIVAINAITGRSRAGCPVEVDIAAASGQTQVGRLGCLGEDSVDGG